MKLFVRPMELNEVEIRIDYFHQSSPEHLERLGVDRTLLPARDVWLDLYRQDYALPMEQRQGNQLLWVGDGQPVGFSSADKIDFGQQANMHLHVLEPDKRNGGIGTECVRQSAILFLKFSNWNDYIASPTRLTRLRIELYKKAGFKFVQTYETTPSEINYPQAVNQWLLKKVDLSR